MDKVKEMKEKTRFVIRNDSIVYCVMHLCANNVLSTCNLKGISIDEHGQCAGLAKIKIKTKK